MWMFLLISVHWTSTVDIVVAENDITLQLERNCGNEVKLKTSKLDC